MKTNKQKSDFLYIGNKLLKWYESHKRELPWRENTNPYNIWISEIILQQTQVKQGLQHYLNFIERFPDVKTLANANENEVLLYWKGLGYYSRALNLHKAAKQILYDFDERFPTSYESLLKLKGVGKYTAAAIASICFNEKIPAIDGNFYRVLSRLFADDFDISSTKAFQYFSELATLIMPDEEPGCFNQAIMDLGSEVCKPKNPICADCPLKEHCIAYQTTSTSLFPVKIKKVKVQNVQLHYQFIYYRKEFLVKQRDTSDIWKKLFEFPKNIVLDNYKYTLDFETTVHHKLTHRNIELIFSKIKIDSKKDFDNLKKQFGYNNFTIDDAEQKSFPKPLHDFYIKYFSD